VSRVVFDQAGVRTPGGRAILDGFSLVVEDGETVALVGPSGGGKTTALKLVNALRRPTAGSVRVDGRATTDWDPIALRRQTGWVIQEVGLFPHLTVAANVAIVPEISGWEPERTRRRVEELLTLVGLPPSEYAERHPHELSGGQRQRVGVARALAVDPPLVLLDEPFGALDPVTRHEIQQQFLRVTRSLGKTSIFVTHDPREAMLLATRIALLREGRLEALDAPADFLQARGEEAQAFRACLG
jgi:osmoprotectant transport system ATP-binding protein